jgi:hypothetical protein
MATLLNKMVSWAAREAEALASKSGITVEKAAEEIADKYGQKAFQATSKPPVEEFATSAPSMFLGDANAPRNKSLRELVSPGVEESITAREASRYTEPGPLNRPVSRAGESAMLGVQESTIARDVSKYSEGLPARQRAVPAVEKSITAREASRYSEPSPPKQPSKSDTSASEDYESSFGNLDTGIPSIRLPVGKVAAGTGALGTALALAGDTRRPQYSALPEGVDEKQFTASVQEALDTQKKQLENKPTTEVKKEAKKGLATTDTAAQEAQKAADKGEIPQSAADRFKQERDRAYQMYNEAKTRNEWLELAQLLGQAATQYGAAQVGMRTGRSMAGLQIPGVDYGTRTAQEQRLLESRLRDIGGEQEREETLAERLRREKREAAADARAERELRLREREAGLPKETAEDRAIRREERTEERKAYKEQLSALDKVVGAQEILASEDTNKKQKQKAEETLLEEANKAGLDIEQIRVQSQVPGVLGGVFGTNLDQKKVLKTIKDSIEALKSGRRGAPTSDTVAPAPAATLSAEDQQALEWAMNNPNDSRSAEIKKRLGR